VLAVPVLVYVLGLSVAEATTASLAVVAAGALAGGVEHAREGRVCWRHAWSVTAAAVPGLAAGTLAGRAVPDRVLLAAFAVVMLVAARGMWRKASEAGDDGEEGAWESGAACPPLRLPRDVAAGAGVGFLTGFLGVGGGFLVVPMLALGMRFPLRRAIGTSLVIVALVSLAALAAHIWQSAELDAGVTLGMAGGCVAGALIGTRLGERLPQRTLAHTFALLVGIAGLYVLLATVVSGGAPGG
jgi:uncharacterized membrane protein YfcA